MIWLAAGVFVFMSLAMAFACRTALVTNQSGRIDAIWTFATGAASAVVALAPAAGAHVARQILVAAIALIWAVRLGGYMWRRATSGPDDPRYAALKQQWGDRAPSRLFWFLQAQAACSLLLVLGAYVAAHAPRTALDWRDIAGALVFIAAITGETLADRQMAAFRRDPVNRGKICDAGLWGWSRHPNYFFEWLGWLAYPLIALQAGYPLGFLAFAAPALMYVLLAHVSGVPPLEQELRRSRPEAFAKYKEKVGVFWPSPPQR